MNAEQWTEELRDLSDDGKAQVVLDGPEATEIATLLEAKKEEPGGAPTE